MKKFLSLLLSALLLITAIPLAGFTVSALDATGQCGENVFWSFSNYTLTISGEGEMYDYDEFESPFCNDSYIRYVVIEDGVTNVCDYAFYKCYYLSSITLPDTLIDIGDNAFEYSNIRTVVIPNNVTNIGNFAFAVCESLNSVTIGSSVINIGECAFYYTALTSVTIPANVTNIGKRAFSYSFKLTSVTITNGVESIGDNAFEKCTALTSITIPNSVKSIGEKAFYECNALTSISIGNGVESIGYSAFYNSPKLTSITVDKDNPNYYSEDNCLIIRENKTLLLGCNNGVIPDGVRCIFIYAFYKCTSVTKISIPKSVEKIGDSAFLLCSSRESITVDKDNPYYYSEGNCLIEKSSKTLILGCDNSVIPDGVKIIGDSAFESCTALTSVIIPDGVTIIDAYAFLHCSSLTSVIIPDSVKTIYRNVFTGANNLIIHCAADSVAVQYCEEYSITYHTFNPWETITAATCVSAGSKTRSCTSCDYTETAKIPVTDNHVDENTDGYCDLCSTELYSHEVEELTFFQKIAQFFQKIIEFFKNLFS